MKERSRSYPELSEDQVRRILGGAVFKQQDFMACLATKIGRSPKSMLHPTHLGRNKKIIDKMQRENKLFKRRVGKAIIWSLTLMSIDKFEADQRASGKKTGEKVVVRSSGESKKAGANASKDQTGPLDERILALEARVRSLEGWKRYVTSAFLEKRNKILRMVAEGEALGKQVTS